MSELPVSVVTTVSSLLASKNPVLEASQLNPAVNKVFVMLILTVSTLSAQPRQHLQPPTAEMRIERLQKDLQLSDDQVKKIKAVFDEEQKALEELQKKHAENLKKEREALNELRKNSESKMLALLTDKQKEQYKQLFPSNPRNPENFVQLAKKELNLTDKQCEQLRLLLEQQTPPQDREPHNKLHHLPPPRGEQRGRWEQPCPGDFEDEAPLLPPFDDME